MGDTVMRRLGQFSLEELGTADGARYSPSAACVAGQCPLHALFSQLPRKRRDQLRLPVGPAALVGIAVHETLEDFVHGHTTWDGDIGSLRAAAVQHFEDKLRQAEATLPSVGRPELVPLRRTMTTRKWRDRVSYLRRTVRALGEAGKVAPGCGIGARTAIPHSRNEGARGGSSRIRTLLDSGEDFFEPEVWLSSSRLGLMGQADVVQRRGDTLTVTDYKSGKVFDSDGGLDRDYAFQLQLYALMLAELAPKLPIKLAVHHSGGEEVVDVELAKVRHEWRRLREVIGNEGRAAPGKQCWKCGYRHLCPSYREELSRAWRHESEAWERPPWSDVWGRILAVVEPENRLFGLDLKRPDGQRVSIRGLRSKWLMTPDGAPIERGQKLAFFGLVPAVSRVRVPGRGFRSAVNFVEDAGDDDPGHSAWALAIFSEDE